MTLYGYYNNNDFVYWSLIGFSITLFDLHTAVYTIHVLIFVDKLIIVP